MICNDCACGNHKPCKVENAKRAYNSCDCQHRTKKDDNAGVDGGTQAGTGIGLEPILG